MKFLKKIFIVLAVLLLILTVGVFFAVKTFDINAYKPQITEKLKNTLHRDVRVGDLDLHFTPSKGLVLSLAGLFVADDQAISGDPLISIKRIHLNIDLISFVTRREVIFQEVRLDGVHITIVKNQDGQLNIDKLIQDISEKPSEEVIPAEDISLATFFVKEAYAKALDAGFALL